MLVKPALVVLVGVALVGGVVCFGQAWRSTGQRRLVPAWSTRPRPPTVSPIALARTRPTAPTLSGLTSPEPAKVAPPVRVEIPAVGLSAGIVAVGLTATDDMEIPSPTAAGWYDLGPQPGAIGPAVLVGHVDSRSGPAVFSRLTAVHVGDTVVVVRADGSIVRFSITAVTVVRKAVFPIRAVFAPVPTRSLRLITCTGYFDPSSHHYTDSLIVWANATP
jgi:sortase (surface protein transpeptidase)